MAYMGDQNRPLTSALQTFMGAKRQAQTKRLVGPASAGSPEALQELMSVNPQMGMMIQDRMSQRQAGEAQAQQAAQAQQLKMQEFKLKQDEAKRKGLKDRYIEVDDKLIDISGETPQEAYAPEPGGFGGFEGSGMTAQAMNSILADAERKGTSPSDLENMKTTLSVRWLSQPKTITTEQGTITMPGLDVTGLSVQTPEQTEARTGEKLTETQAKTQSVMSGSVIPGTERTAPLQRDYNKGFSMLKNVDRTLSDYGSVLKELGPQYSIGPINAKNRQKLASAYQGVMLELKNLAELGVLAGPDMDILNNWIPDPTTAEAQLKGAEALIEGYKQVNKFLENRKKTFQEQYEGMNVKTKEFDVPKAALPKDAVAMLKENDTPEMRAFFKKQFGKLPEGL